MNAVVVLEGFEMELFGKEQGEHGASHLAMSELMHEIERYNGAVVLTVSTPSALSMYNDFDTIFFSFGACIWSSMPARTRRAMCATT